jgi:hypothetical protein
MPRGPITFVHWIRMKGKTVANENVYIQKKEEETLGRQVTLLAVLEMLRV